MKAYKEFITPQNAEEIIAEYDFVIDAVDNFEAKFLINDACVLGGQAVLPCGYPEISGAGNDLCAGWQVYLLQMHL